MIIVAALDRAGAIGRDGGLPWRLPDDLRRFKALTIGGTLLMGWRTAESLGRALPGRRQLVLSRSGQAPYVGMEPVASLEEAVALAGDAPLLVAGGAAVYAAALPQATAMHLTHVETTVEGADTWFPPWDAAQWEVVAEEHHPPDDRHAVGFRFVDYRRAADRRPGVPSAAGG